MPFFSPYSYAGGVSRALVRFFREFQLPASLLILQWYTLSTPSSNRSPLEFM